MSGREQELTRLKEAIDKGKDMRYRAEAKLEELENQKQRLLAELAELGVKPEELDGEIARLEQEIDNGLRETWAKIPKELMSQNG
ncbi:MAG TPA: hypothetical protein GX525_02710 [Bacilli bacterium]|nr:hypothetical protein [Bacilli bacterium]